jgi:hypothetical protein
MKRVLAIVALHVALSATPAIATPLVFTYSGVFSPTTTLNGVEFGVNTPFSFEASFDSGGDIYAAAEGAGIFDAVVSFQIGGATYTSDPAGDVNVFLQDPSHSDTGNYVVGLSNSLGSIGFLGVFATATPVIDADVPVQSTFSGFLGHTSALPFTIPLLDGAGDLVLSRVGIVSLGATAEVTAATPAPEPTSLLLFGTGAVGVIARLRRRKQQYALHAIRCGIKGWPQ